MGGGLSYDGGWVELESRSSVSGCERAVVGCGTRCAAVRCVALIVVMTVGKSKQVPKDHLVVPRSALCP